MDAAGLLARVCQLPSHPLPRIVVSKLTVKFSGLSISPPPSLHPSISPLYSYGDSAGINRTSLLIRRSGTVSGAKIYESMYYCAMICFRKEYPINNMSFCVSSSILCFVSTSIMSSITAIYSVSLIFIPLCVAGISLPV